MKPKKSGTHFRGRTGSEACWGEIYGGGAGDGSHGRVLSKFRKLQLQVLSTPYCREDLGRWMEFEREKGHLSDDGWIDFGGPRK